jgi:hypothetical protein
MRWLTLICFAGFCFKTASAQNQERSLIDRLLRPNMDLQNEAQGKTFVANSKVVAQRENAATIVLEPTAKEKAFGTTRAAVTREYPSGSVRAASGQDSFVETRQISVSGQQLKTSSAQDLHTAYDAHRNVSGRVFGDERVFRDEGKSQKSLNRQNPPLTIDQVRELLNKNK